MKLIIAVIEIMSILVAAYFYLILEMYDLATFFMVLAIYFNILNKDKE
jgi:hypothetical protein